MQNHYPGRRKTSPLPPIDLNVDFRALLCTWSHVTLRAATTVGKGKEVQSREEETDTPKCDRLALGLLASSSKPAEALSLLILVLTPSHCVAMN